MGLFDLFRKNKTELSDEQEKWNKMWNLWEENRADTPYAELMTYQSEINNGGHDQYFLNVENTEYRRFAERNGSFRNCSIGKAAKESARRISRLPAIDRQRI